MLIKDVMMKNPMVIHENDLMEVALQVMKTYSVDSFPVIDQSSRPTGILMRSVFDVNEANLWGKKTKEVMRPIDHMSIVKEFEETDVLFNRPKELFFVVDEVGRFKSIIRKRHVMKRLYEKHRVCQQYLEDLLVSSDVAVLMTGRSGMIIKSNAKAESLLNEGKSLIQKTIHDLPDDLKLEHHIDSEVGESQQIIILNDSKYKLIQYPVIREGHYLGKIIMISETYDHDFIENQLSVQKSENRILKTIFEIAYDGLIVTDADGYVTMISNAYKKFLKLDNEDVVGKHVTEVIENTRMHLVAKTGVPEIGDLQRINDSYIVASRIPVLEDGKVTHVVGKVMFRNIGELDDLYTKINKIEEQLENYKNELTQANRSKYSFNSIVGQSPLIKQAISMAKKSAYTNSNVLILGESGTGKELFAHAIHNSSARRSKPFVKVNCAAIPAELLESELFGYEEGAFTGAKKGGKMGKFEVADQGTIFLDEIGDMPLNMQAKLLRVIQEREVEKIGSNQVKRIDVRIIAATNRDIESMIQEKRFRLDLYYRLNVVTIEVPPLRDRKEDISGLAEVFIDKLRARYLKKVEGISDVAIEKLSRYQWPGNIRELENIIERAINIMEPDTVIKPKHLPVDIAGTYDLDEVKTLRQIVEETEKKAILNCLEFMNHNKSKVAKTLGISRTALYEKLEKYNIEL